MQTYHKINAPFKRYPDGKLMVGDWSVPEFGYLCDCEWEFTEKVDGTNIRIHYTRVEDTLFVTYGGRTDKADIPKYLLPRLEYLFPPSARYRRDLWADHHYAQEARIGTWMVDNDIDSVTFYGEGYGPKIQKGDKYGPDHDFVLFDVKIGDWWLLRNDVNEIADTLQIRAVPEVGRGTILDGIKLVKNGLTSQWGNFEAEGVVAVPRVPLFNRKGERIVTKIKAKDFR